LAPENLDIYVIDWPSSKLEIAVAQNDPSRHLWEKPMKAVNFVDEQDNNSHPFTITSVAKTIFESLKAEFPRLKEIVQTIPNDEERKQLEEYVQGLTEALAEEESSSDIDSIFFINCALTSWTLLLYKLARSIKEFSQHEKNPYRNTSSGSGSRVEPDESKETQMDEAHDQVKTLTCDLEALTTQTPGNEHESGSQNSNPADSNKEKDLRDATNSMET
uniref:Intraflagellar transport protein 46 homolog n=1 Tax=Rodentolepis nana TaxID=102285 RepID=A0A0R3TX27_RODNA